MAGLVSVSFRKLNPKEIILLAKEAGLGSVEWGGDIHVPAGDTKKAHEVRLLTEKAGLKISSYGSYYRIGVSEKADFGGVLASAKALGISIIRVWAYNKASAAVDGEAYARVVDDAKRICALANDFTVCLECHGGTLTDDYRSALKLLADVNCANLAMFWQPNQFRSFEYNMEAAKALAPYCKCVHTFAWEGKEKFPLDFHFGRWQSYAEAIRKAAPHAEFLLEFMHDDRPESLPQSACTLRKILQ